jgi:rSAM/selenodomain-associated transferase 2
MISIVIPVLNDREKLTRCLENMQAVSGIETIVVDGGSSDGSPEEAGKHPVTVVRTARGRAGQMNAGAAAAAGEVLLFLHVDTVLPSDFPLLLEHVVHDGQAVGGAFTFAVDGRGAFYRFIERTANFRSRYMRVVFGDQAIFATSTAFRSAGGYPDQPVMEDCAFADRLRRQGNFIILPQKAVTSARRWEEAGPLWNTLVNVVITWAYRLGVSPERLKKWHKRAMRVQW